MSTRFKNLFSHLLNAFIIPQVCGLEYSPVICSNFDFDQNSSKQIFTEQKQGVLTKNQIIPLKDTLIEW